MNRRTRIVIVVSALVGALLGPIGSASAQTTPPAGEWMPLVGEYTVWCTWSGNGGPCGEPGHAIHHDSPAIDLNADPGTPVYAAADGVITSVQRGCGALQNDGCNNGAGNHVVIDHGDHRSRYLHLSEIAVTEGPIGQGAILGTTGNSGSTANAHLHYDEITDENYGDRVDSGDMWACHGEVAVSYPQELGHENWADVPYGSTVRNDGYECLGGVTAKLAPPTPSRFVPMAPVRLFDTRTDAAPSGRLAPGESLVVDVAGRLGVPEDATAVVMNVTATDTFSEGFVTVWPAGLDRPNVSSLNVVSDGQTVANMVTVMLGDDGAVALYTQGGAELVGDLAGYYVPQVDAVAEGRLVPVVPSRLFDTRAGEGSGIEPRSSIDVMVPGRAGVPTEGVSAVVLNVTATEGLLPGHITVWPTGATRPVVSNLNLNGPDEDVPNLAIVPLGEGGKVSFYAHGGAQVLADVTGYITDDTVSPAMAGLFVPLDPYRVFDTRTSLGTSAYVSRMTSIDVGFTSSFAVPDEVTAVVLNVTGTEPAEAGFVTAWPTGVARPLASTLNLADEDDTRANGAILPVGENGEVSFFAHRGTHLIADLAGYYLPADET